MKVVLFCGGAPVKLTENDRPIPKPMVMVGYRPVLWHVMRWYAHWGMRDFVLCLGYGGDLIKSYFLDYSEALSNDFVLSAGTGDVRLLQSDIRDWTITFADTGVNATISQRLRAVREHVRREEIFCANYGDVLSDASMADMVETFRSQPGKVASFMSVRQRGPFHVVEQAGDGTVTALRDVSASDVWIDNGFFVLRQAIFDAIEPGDADLPDQPFQRLLARNQLISQRHDGFWIPMNTLRDVQELMTLEESGQAPWAVWRRSQEGGPAGDES